MNDTEKLWDCHGFRSNKMETIINGVLSATLPSLIATRPREPYCDFPSFPHWTPVHG